MTMMKIAIMKTTITVILFKIMMIIMIVMMITPTIIAVILMETIIKTMNLITMKEERCETTQMRMAV